jgi:hypothetical protein
MESAVRSDSNRTDATEILLRGSSFGMVSSEAISRAILQACHATAAIMAPSLIVVRNVCG